MRNNNYICHTPYLRNCTSSDHNFWYTYVKWWYLQGFFTFSKFCFLGCYGGKRVKNSPEWKITMRCYVPYLRSSIAHDHYFWCTCVKWWYLQVFFSGFQNFDFLSCKGGKRAKNGPKGQKKLSVAVHIAGSIHYMIVIYGRLV